MYEGGAGSFDDMNNIPKALRAKLAKVATVGVLEVRQGARHSIVCFILYLFQYFAMGVVLVAFLQASQVNFLVVSIYWFPGQGETCWTGGIRNR